MLDQFHHQLHTTGELICTLRVRPHAAVTHIKDVLADGSIKIDLAAPAEDNKANIELLRFLAETFDVAIPSITILSGATARVKVVRISA